MSKCGVISGPCLPAFGLNTKRYEVSLRFSPNAGKCPSEKSFQALQEDKKESDFV